MKGLGIYAAATALTMERLYNPEPKPYIKPPKTKKVRANRAKNKRARKARKNSSK